MLVAFVFVGYVLPFVDLGLIGLLIVLMWFISLKLQLCGMMCRYFAVGCLIVVWQCVGFCAWFMVCKVAVGLLLLDLFWCGCFGLRVL